LGVPNGCAVKCEPANAGLVGTGHGLTWRTPPCTFGGRSRAKPRPGPFGTVPSLLIRPEVGPRQNRLEDYGRRFCKIVVGVGSRYFGPFGVCLRGRPWGRSVASNPNRLAVCSTQPGSPKGLPRTTERRR